MNDKVVLVNEQGEVQGLADKLEAHEQGLLHLAFSLMIYREICTDGLATRQYLLQRRAATKYHGANLWSNTCCSHPVHGETPAAAAQRRVGEELGIRQILSLKAIEPLYYYAEMPNGLIEHEYDHIFVCSDALLPFDANQEEVSQWEWVDAENLHIDLCNSPERYTPWLPLVLRQIERADME